VPVGETAVTATPATGAFVLASVTLPSIVPTVPAASIAIVDWATTAAVRDRPRNSDYRRP